uniref:Putative secreted protein n=1 Tax=Rhipicephalus microplus TaxID=6941 RepID=A0A6M2DBV9_RHIMP
MVALVGAMSQLIVTVSFLSLRHSSGAICCGVSTRGNRMALQACGGDVAVLYQRVVTGWASLALCFPNDWVLAPHPLVRSNPFSHTPSIIGIVDAACSRELWLHIRGRPVVASPA